MAFDEAHWRDAARSARFFFVDAIAAIPLVVMLLHIRLWTFILAVSALVFFAILEKFKFTIPIFFRWLRAFIAGPYRSTNPWWRD